MKSFSTKQAKFSIKSLPPDVLEANHYSTITNTEL